MGELNLKVSPPCPRDCENLVFHSEKTVSSAANNLPKRSCSTKTDFLKDIIKEKKHLMRVKQFKARVSEANKHDFFFTFKKISG